MRLIRDHKAWAAITFLVLGCVVVTLSAIPVALPAAANHWIVSDKLDKPADAIVVLGGGYDRRARAAADLYKRGLGRKVWITHSDLEYRSPKEGRASSSADEFTRALLIDFGVPEQAIVDVPGEVSSTYEEAQLVSKLMRVTGAKSLVVPTDPFHTFRVKWIFKKLLGDKEIKVIVQPIFRHTYSSEQWWQSPQGRSDFANEFVKYIYYRIRY